MASNIKNFKCLIHFNETSRGSILSEDLTYSMLHEMVMQKFNLEANAEINFSFKLSSFDFAVDITDDAEVQFFVGSNEYNTDDVVNENPQKKFHKWQKFMSFEPDIPETPVYKAKPNISKQYTQQSEVEKDRSAPERCHLKCYHFNQCDWKLRARLWDNTEQYYITHLNDVHTCPKTQTYPNHRNANKKVIGHLLTPKLQDRSRVLRGKDIQQDILSEYKIHISYQQAMKGKHYGIQQVRGSPYEAFEMLPYYCYNLEQKNEGTVTRIKTDDKGVFEMLFIAIGASVNSYVPQLSTPGAYGLYKGTNLVAVAMDGNNQIVPIVFGICKGETAMAVENEFPLAFHVAYTREDYATSMNILQIVQPDAYEKLCRAGPQR
ncbi:hypothetical protein Tco_0983417 [Tanacetum coccineum]